MGESVESHQRGIDRVLRKFRMHVLCSSKEIRTDTTKVYISAGSKGWVCRKGNILGRGDNEDGKF